MGSGSVLLTIGEGVSPSSVNPYNIYVLYLH